MHTHTHRHQTSRASIVHVAGVPSPFRAKHHITIPYITYHTQSGPSMRRSEPSFARQLTNPLALLRVVAGAIKRLKAHERACGASINLSLASRMLSIPEPGSPIFFFSFPCYPVTPVSPLPEALVTMGPPGHRASPPLLPSNNDTKMQTASQNLSSLVMLLFSTPSLFRREKQMRRGRIKGINHGLIKKCTGVET